MKPIDIDEGWKLLEQASFNGRTLICWLNPKNDIISIFLFNLLSQPNDLSRRSNLSQWGWSTHYVSNITTTMEASQVVGLYLQDMEKQNYWWEADEYPSIPPTQA